MLGEVTINTNTIMAIAVILILFTVFFVLIKLIQLLNELIITVKQSHKTIDHVDVVLSDVSNTLKNVEPMIGDVHEKYFAVSDSLTKAVGFLSGFTAKSSRKKEEK